MKKNNVCLIIGIISFLLLFSITASNYLKTGESNLQNTMDSHRFSKLNLIPENNNMANAGTTSKNDSGCSSILVHVKKGHDVLSYRRDSGYPADIIINKVNFNDRTAIKEYKTQKGYFTHTIITENGWIISIGGKDDPNTNKYLEKLGSDIISKGYIEKKDMQRANAVIRQSGWGHFVIKSPDDDVGVTANDYRTSYSMTRLFKMNDGDYIKVPNNPRYYNHGNFNKFSNDPINAAIEIAGKDIYGQDRRNIITYEYTNDNNVKNINIWASFDGGALIRGRGTPDNILYMENRIARSELPKIPGKKFLGNQKLNNNSIMSSVLDDQSTISSIDTAKDLKSYLNQLNI